MGALAGLLVVAALLALFAGFATLTGVTGSVSMFALACFLGILARLAQAAAQHQEIKAALLGGHTRPESSSAMIRCAACGVESTRGPKACPKCGAAY